MSSSLLRNECSPAHSFDILGRPTPLVLEFTIGFTHCKGDPMAAIPSELTTGVPASATLKGDESLADKLARYCNPTFAAAAIAHVHEAKRLALAAPSPPVVAPQCVGGQPAPSTRS